MPDGRRFEDYITVEDLIKKDTKELMAEIYIQCLKTNGTMAKNCHDIANLQTEMKDKIGMKLFAIITGIVGLLIVIFNVIDRVMT